MTRHQMEEALFHIRTCGMHVHTLPSMVRACRYRECFNWTRKAFMSYDWKNILLLICVILFISGASCNSICDADLGGNLDDVQLKDFVHQGAVPLGRLNAGLYTKHLSARTLGECVQLCCSKLTCDSVMYTESCFLIHCNRTLPHACDPMYKDTNAYLVNVRSKVGDTMPVLLGSRTCDPGDVTSLLDDPCPVYEECGLMTSEMGIISGWCICVRGYIREMSSGRCVAEHHRDRFHSETPTHQASITTEKSTRSIVRVCEIGLLHQCLTNEECKTTPGSKSRQGKCRCIEGYQLDNADHCQATTHTSDLFETLSTMTGTSTPNIDAKKSDAPHNSQSSPNPSTTTKIYKPDKVIQLTVSAGDSKVIQLPENGVTLSAFVVPKADEGETYHYEWTLTENPKGASETGTLDGKNTETLKLSHLIAGSYTFQIVVTGINKYGETTVNVTVLPPTRKNEPPVAIINPKTQEVQTSNSAILDGSVSTDDDKIVSYHWEEVSGPLRDQKLNADTAIMTLRGLIPGKYVIKLTVTDSDGAVNSTSANVTVVKEMDYPPVANAGSDVMINLPQRTVKLYGNSSTDDKGIVSYEWIRSNDNKLTADMSGTREMVLTLANLEVGDYMFTLKVTDVSGQSSTTNVHVYVKPEHNLPPVAVTEKASTVYLPLKNIILDAGNSSDDQGIAKYAWEQLSGPSTLTIENSDRAVATATGNIVVGKYKFRIVVSDAEDLQGTDTLVVNVEENQNQAPIANAGGDQIVFLPQRLIALDGSKSHDDRGIKSYDWRRDDRSLAAGEVVNNSNSKAILQVMDLVAGRYIFVLVVADDEGLNSHDTATVIVKKDPYEDNIVELHLDADIRSFTEANRKSLVNQLSFLLHTSDMKGMTTIVIQDIREDLTTKQLVIEFYAQNVVKDAHMPINGYEAMNILKSKLSSNINVLDFKVLSVNAAFCQYNCSGHGHCEHKSQLCICEAFWMPNLFKFYIAAGETNCDWSILYVVIVCFVVVVTLAGSVWLICCLMKSKRWRWRMKKHKYSLLREVEDKNGIELEKKVAGRFQNSSVMLSDSELTSDEETLFINHKKSNGHIQKPLNGLSRHFKTKLRT